MSEGLADIGQGRGRRRRGEQEKEGEEEGPVSISPPPSLPVLFAVCHGTECV